MDVWRSILYVAAIGVCVSMTILAILAGRDIMETQRQMQILHNQMQVEHEKIIRIAERILNEGTTK